MTEETKTTQQPKSKTPRLAVNVEDKSIGKLYQKGTPVEVLKTYEDTGHHRVRVMLGDGETSPDMVVGPNDIA